MKAIETKYAGCRFRSRLEARWAVCFDHLGFEWEYEPEGFELKSGRYLPDFYLPDYGWWFEVKGVMSDYDQARCDEFSEAVGGNFTVLGGVSAEALCAQPTWQPDAGDDFWLFEIDPDSNIPRAYHFGGTPAFHQEPEVFLSPSLPNGLKRQAAHNPDRIMYGPMTRGGYVGDTNDEYRRRAEQFFDWVFRHKGTDQRRPARIPLFRDGFGVYASEEKIQLAIEAARSARFEHGECG